MLCFTVLIDARKAPLKNTKISLDVVRMYLASSVFTMTVANNTVFIKFIPNIFVGPKIIGHKIGFFCDLFSDYRF